MQDVVAQMNSVQRQALDTLRAFTGKLRPKIAEYGLDGFDIKGDPEQGLREVLSIELRPRPGAQNLHQSFEVADMRIRPITSYDQDSMQVREMVDSHFQEARRSGGVGGIVILVVDTVTDICQAFSVGFNETATERPRNPDWKRLLTECINEGKFL